MKQMSYILLLIGFLITMLCFPQETFHGATEGLLLWFQIIIPTLLPFIILSNILTQTNCVSYISRTLKPFIKRLFHVSEESCYAILIGFLCGYPMGAKVIADLISTNRISIKEGQYLLSFCNNTSPMFIISYIVMQTFKNENLTFGTICILFLSPIVCSFLFRIFYKSTSCDVMDKQNTNKIVFDFQIFDYAIMNGFETITKVGGYIILFSILFTLGLKLPIKYLIPILEISNGIPAITQLSSSLTFTYPYILGLTSFGGLCAVAQTKSMIQKSGLKIRPYIIQKLITSMVTSSFAYIYIRFIL